MIKMALTETTLFVLNMLMVAMIIGIYVSINRALHQQELRIAVMLQQEREGFKEAMSPAQRWTRARKYRTSQNGLMPSWNQPEKQLPYLDEMTSNRGDRPMSYLLVNDAGLNVSQEDAMKSGANAISGSGYDSSIVVPDTSALPVETQTGVINTEKVDPTNFSSNPRVSPSFLETSTTFAPNEGGQERFRASRR